MSNTKKQKKNHWWMTVAPLYIFTIVFVALPIIYLIVLSFLTRAETWGVVGQLTLDNYKKILNPTYLNTFRESFQLAILTTFFTLLIGYPFGYFMARLEKKAKSLMMLGVVIPFWTSALLRMCGWIIIFRSNGLLDKVLMGLGFTQEPLKLLYSYPAVLVGMIYSLLPFMILSVYSSTDKMDWSLVEASRDLGATRFQAF
ncbi:MAG: ABC transporter permease [Lachnospiraceae bacterium]